ncbi:hypothetical protein EDB81DRAFT_950663 [Dactylonectria macrodidyma]|uniref:Uncharacterized protein n=1 Tax=Dactylonectria macrodidyma TaxID=307937 RepID=A0A9P9IRW4_9HYPO|nr:hypothetical protein EDB81DRAFT_950663 [Dactylonectria macrodidyma]
MSAKLACPERAPATTLLPSFEMSKTKGDAVTQDNVVDESAGAAPSVDLVAAAERRPSAQPTDSAVLATQTSSQRRLLLQNGSQLDLARAALLASDGKSNAGSSVPPAAASSAKSLSSAKLDVLNPPATAQGQAVNEVFDFANFMWDSGGFWQQVNSLLNTVPAAPARHALDVCLDPVVDVTADLAIDASLPLAPSLPPTTTAEQRLLDTLLGRIVVDMAFVSTMVRYAILAFSSSVLVSSQGSWDTTNRGYYDSALAELSRLDSPNLLSYITYREHLLATLFFIPYVDILESQLDATQMQLNCAYVIFQPHASRNHGLSTIEKQFFLWFCILDSRTVSSAGDGSFLSPDEILHIEPSPASLDGEDNVSKTEARNRNLKDVLLSIDPWHRSRGTMDDEMEVLGIADNIAKDPRLLYEQRPPLIDFAAIGQLTDQHISPQLALAVTRSFRTYLSNYYSSKVHLHRVAFTTLPLTEERAGEYSTARTPACRWPSGRAPASQHAVAAPDAGRRGVKSR